MNVDLNEIIISGIINNITDNIKRKWEHGI